MKSVFLICLLLIMAPLPLSAEYVLYESFDSPGGDLTTIPNLTVKKMHAFCDNTTNCLGFNTNGTFKNSLQPVARWTQWTNQPLKGFYRKVSNYNFTAGLDTPGGDIAKASGLSVAQLKVTCEETPSCIGFNTDGTLKSSVQARTKWTKITTTPSSGLYLKANVTIPQPIRYNYTVYNNTMAGGDKIGKQYDQQQAQEACDADETCLGISKWGEDPKGAYWPVKAYWPPSTWYGNYRNDYGEYKLLIKVKIPAQATPLTLPLPSNLMDPSSNQGDYTYTMGLFVTGEVISRVAGLTIAQLKTYCDSFPQCAGFLTEGVMFRTLGPKSEWKTETVKFYGRGSCIKNAYV